MIRAELVIETRTEEQVIKRTYDEEVVVLKMDKASARKLNWLLGWESTIIDAVMAERGFEKSAHAPHEISSVIRGIQGALWDKIQ